MKRRHLEQAERRRPLVEVNLVTEPKSRSTIIARRGCALFGVLATVLVASLAAFLGLH
jgi:hypothetical protein